MHAKSARTPDPYVKRDFANGPHPFETMKRVDNPTTDIDAPNVARDAKAIQTSSNAANIKEALYFLGVEAVRLSACPDWTYYGHDVAGQPITPCRSNTISMIIDRGYETMEGASGEDWIAHPQSMRAYFRLSLLGRIWRSICAIWTILRGCIR